MARSRLTTTLLASLTMACGTSGPSAPSTPDANPDVAYMVSDINAGLFSSRPWSFVPLSGQTVFAADDGVHGRELWRSDGTSAGSWLLRDFEPSFELYSPSPLAELDGVLYFSADDGLHGFELWRTDGTPEGTYLVKDIWPGSRFSGSHPANATALGRRLIFRAQDGTVGAGALWSTDGTGTGTSRLFDVLPEGAPVRLGDRLYFFAYEPGSGGAGHQLWRTDGTPLGTSRAVTLTLTSSPQALTTAGGLLYFTATDAAHGTELWRSDGTLAGTGLVQDIRPGSEGADPRLLVAAGGSQLYFSARSPRLPGYATTVWVTDGSALGTRELAMPSTEGSAGVWELRAIGGRAFVAAGQPSSLWVSDAQATGLSLLRSGGNPTELTEHGGRLFFTVEDDEHGRELWTSDGTPAGTRLAADIAAGARSSRPEGLLSLGERLFFSADDGVNGVEPWAFGALPAGQPTLPGPTAPPVGNNRPPTIERLGANANISTADVDFVLTDPDGDAVHWTASLTRDDGKEGVGSLSSFVCDGLSGTPTRLSGIAKSGNRVSLSYNGVLPTAQHPTGSVIVTVTANDGRGGEAQPQQVRIGIF